MTNAGCREALPAHRADPCGDNLRLDVADSVIPKGGKYPRIEQICVPVDRFLGLSLFGRKPPRGKIKEALLCATWIDPLVSQLVGFDGVAKPTGVEFARALSASEPCDLGLYRALGHESSTWLHTVANRSSDTPPMVMIAIWRTVG